MRAILTYHSVDSSDSLISVSEAVFRGHVAWLSGGRVRVVPLEELVRISDEVDAVSLTFDDGFANFATVAAPLLEDASLPATVFVVSDFVGGANTWGGMHSDDVPVLPLLDWPQVAGLHERGFSIGAHSRTHVRLTGLSRAQLEDEVGGCGEIIRRETGATPRAFCYPYGSSGAEAATVVSSFYELACTTELEPLSADTDIYMLPRFDMYYFRGAGRLESWGSAAFERYLRLRRRARTVRGSIRRAVRGRDG
ncbi:MAG: polysaccharide deacetylase family protein [Gemmatimonadaceae bacterium]|nr:polysaccharide deacetylase family protein [Gemmatimonadaceae bacterium]